MKTISVMVVLAVIVPIVLIFMIMIMVIRTNINHHRARANWIKMVKIIVKMVKMMAKMVQELRNSITKHHKHHKNSPSHANLHYPVLDPSRVIDLDRVVVMGLILMMGWVMMIITTMAATTATMGTTTTRTKMILTPSPPPPSTTPTTPPPIQTRPNVANIISNQHHHDPSHPIPTWLHHQHLAHHPAPSHRLKSAPISVTTRAIHTTLAAPIVPSHRTLIRPHLRSPEPPKDISSSIIPITISLLQLHIQPTLRRTITMVLVLRMGWISPNHNHLHFNSESGPFPNVFSVSNNSTTSFNNYAVMIWKLGVCWCHWRRVWGHSDYIYNHYN